MSLSAFRVPLRPTPGRTPPIKLACGLQRTLIVSSRIQLAAASRRDPSALMIDVATGTIARNGVTTTVTRQVCAFVVALAGCPGAVIPTPDLAARLYGDDPNGGPVTVDQVLYGLTIRARAALYPLGLAIETEPTRGRWLRCCLSPLSQEVWGGRIDPKPGVSITAEFLGDPAQSRSALADRQRKVVALWQEELDTAEISRRTGLSEAGVIATLEAWQADATISP